MRRDLKALAGLLLACCAGLPSGVAADQQVDQPAAIEWSGVAVPGGSAVGTETSIQIAPLESVSLKVVAEGVAPDDGCLVRYGTLDGYTNVLNVVVLQCPDGMAMAEIRDFRANRRCVVFTDAAGNTRSQTTYSFPRAYDPSRPDGRTPPAAAPAAAVRRSVRRAAAERAGAVPVDVLVAYDQPAQDWVDLTQGGITNFARLGVARMNMVLANSGLADKFHFRLAGVATVAAKGGEALDTVLDNVTDGLGAWSAVRAAREACAADVVTTLVDTGSAYGWAGLGWSLDAGADLSAFGAYAFNVCSVRSVAESDTMLHEIGHNMGAGHADAAHMDEGHGPQLHAYSAGYYFTSAGGVPCHTVMAYNVDRNGYFYDDVPYFSTPDRSLDGVPVGDAAHDNVRTLVATYPSVAAFRDGGGAEEPPDASEPEAEAAPSLYAVPAGTPFAGNAVYAGWLRDASGAFAGAVAFKAGKPARDGTCKLACSYAPFGGRRRNVRDLSPKTAPATGNPEVSVPEIGTLRLGGDSLAGAGFDLQAGKDLLKDRATKADAARRLSSLQGTWTFVLRTGAGDAGLSVKVGKNGKAKLAGVLPDGTRVSVSAQGVLGESALAVPFSYARKGAFACVFWLKEDGGAVVSDATALRLADGTALPVEMVAPARVSENRVAGAHYFRAGAFVQPFTASEKKMDAGKRDENPSGLKLRLNAGTGLLTGSYRDETGRHSVAGAFVDGVFYGSVYDRASAGGAASIEAR